MHLAAHRMRMQPQNFYAMTSIIEIIEMVKKHMKETEEIIRDSYWHGFCDAIDIEQKNKLGSTWEVIKIHIKKCRDTYKRTF